MEAFNSKSIIKTAAGVPVALIAWWLITILAYLAFDLLYIRYGLDKNSLQGLINEWFIPGFGGCIAMYMVNKYLHGANIKWVAILFCSLLLIIYIGLPLYFIAFHSSEFVFSWKEDIMQWGMSIAACIGAVTGYIDIKRGRSN